MVARLGEHAALRCLEYSERGRDKKENHRLEESERLTALVVAVIVVVDARPLARVVLLLLLRRRVLIVEVFGHYCRRETACGKGWRWVDVFVGELGGQTRLHQAGE
jgi:hypothetical protein